MESSAKKQPTLGDVARVAGVSKATASLALNNNPLTAARTREAVLQAAESLGYETNLLAQNWSKGRCHNTVGLFSLNLEFGIRTQKLHAIQNVLTQNGFDVPLYISRTGESDNPVALLRTLRRQRPRALVYNTSEVAPHWQADLLAELERYENEGGIVVSYDYPTELACDQVLFDREHNTYLAAKHLLEQGHRQIGFCHFRYHDPDRPRFRGFVRALAEYGLEPRADWIWSGGSYEERGAKLAAEFVALAERPTAVCVVNDVAASVFVNEIQRAGLRVPRDVSVVGHDDILAARYAAVRLTTVTHPVAVIAQQVVELLLRRMGGGENDAPQQIICRGELVERDSVAAF